MKTSNLHLKKSGEVPNYSAATEMSLHPRSEEDRPTREALARGQLWHSAAVPPKTGLLGDKQPREKELAKPWRVLLF